MKPLNIFCVNNGMKFVSRFASALLLLSFILTPFTTVFAQNTDFFKDHRKITGSEFDISQLENPQLNEIKALLQKVEENKRVFMAEGGDLATPPPSSIDYANPHAPISINGVPLSYDKNGNLLFDGTTTYTYDYNNQLISTTKGGVTTTYLYDHMGQRIATISPTKTTYYPSKYYNVDSTGKVTKHIFAGDSMIATVSSGSSVNEITSSCMPPTTGDWIISTSCTFTGNTVAPASVIVNAGKVLTLSPNSKLLIDLKHYKLLVKHTGGVLIKKGATLRQVKPEDTTGLGAAGTTIAYHLTDHLGSTQVSTDATGAVTELSDYYPFGSPKLDQTTGAKEQRKFIGQEYDEDTGLNYLNARYYDSKRGQFISQDPVFWEVGQTPEGKAAMMNPQTMNSYSYAGNNPITNKDPSGRCAEDLCIVETSPIWAPYVIAGVQAGLSTLGVALGIVAGETIVQSNRQQFIPLSQSARIINEKQFGLNTGGEGDPNNLKNLPKWMTYLTVGGLLAKFTKEVFDPVNEQIEYTDSFKNKTDTNCNGASADCARQTTISSGKVKTKQLSKPKSNNGTSGSSGKISTPKPGQSGLIGPLQNKKKK